MKKLMLIVCIHFLYCHSLTAQIWHVSVTGNDSSDGRTLKTAYRTLQKAANVVRPGDVVLIGAGIYSNEDKSNGGAVVSIANSGTKDAWITWKPEPGERPEIHAVGWAGIQITGSYHIIEGLTVTGNNDAIVLLDAQQDAKNTTPNPYFNSNGIVIEGRNNKASEKPHHHIIRNCVVGKCAGGGIVGLESDYLTIEDCHVFNNAWFMRYGGSGISTLNNWAFDDAPGYHTIIQRNYVWNNKTLVNWEHIGKLSDGNGIILDVTDQEVSGATNPNADAAIKKDTAITVYKAKPKRPEWKGRALVANNVSAFNGGSGIHTFRTKYVDIINNTTYHNGSIVGYSELFSNNSEDIVILNNIIVPRQEGKVTSNYKNTNVRWDYNVYPTDQKVLKGANDIVADPMFINVPEEFTNILKSDFRLAKASKALNSGTSEVAQPTDINKKSRPKTIGIDRGAFEQ